MTVLQKIRRELLGGKVQRLNLRLFLSDRATDALQQVSLADARGAVQHQRRQLAELSRYHPRGSMRQPVAVSADE